MNDIKIDKVWLTDAEICIRTIDGRESSEKFSDYPSLRNATPEQRMNYTTSQEGIHWPELDEDLCFEGFFKEKENSPLYNLFMAHPELNASAIARRLGISQSLFAQYISGIKKPSKQRYEKILEEIRIVGSELANITTGE